jgi:hypothetical protein
MAGAATFVAVIAAGQEFENVVNRNSLVPLHLLRVY